MVEEYEEYEEEAADDKTIPSLESDCSEPTVIKSKTTGTTKNMKRSKRKDFESAGIELMKSIGSKIDQIKETETDKDEETIFSELIGTQLKKMLSELCFTLSKSLINSVYYNTHGLYLSQFFIATSQKHTLNKLQIYRYIYKLN